MSLKRIPSNSVVTELEVGQLYIFLTLTHRADLICHSFFFFSPHLQFQPVWDYKSQRETRSNYPLLNYYKDKRCVFSEGMVLWALSACGRNHSVTDILLPAFPKHVVPTSQGFFLSFYFFFKWKELQKQWKPDLQYLHVLVRHIEKYEHVHKYEKNYLFTWTLHSKIYKYFINVFVTNK